MEQLDFPEILYENHLREIGGVKFTPREIEIIAFILSGRSGKKIASFLSIAPKTVENHTQNIMGKLKCNSRENIIDFIEKSGKFPFVKQYYPNWLIHREFKEILKALSFSKAKVTCSIVRWLHDESDYGFLPYLNAHLTLADVKVSYDNRQLNSPFFRLAAEPTGDVHQVYLLPQGILDDLKNFALSSSQSKVPLSKLFILPTKPTDEEVFALRAYDILELAHCKNYYFFVFEILKRLFTTIPMEKSMREFQDKLAALSFPHAQDQILHPHRLYGSTQNLAPRKPNKYSILPVLISVGLERGWFHEHTRLNHASKVKESGMGLIRGHRSDPVIPTVSIILDHIEATKAIRNLEQVHASEGNMTFAQDAIHKTLNMLAQHKPPESSLTLESLTDRYRQQSTQAKSREEDSSQLEALKKNVIKGLKGSLTRAEDHFPKKSAVRLQDKFKQTGSPPRKVFTRQIGKNL